MTDRIYLSKAEVTEVEEEFVLRALRSGWIAPLGPDVEAFEREIAERVGLPHALALSSGTAALHLALLAIGAGPGKMVVLPSMTFAASANAVAYTGATPVFVDSDAEDGNIDPDLLMQAVDQLHAEGHEIAAVMTVDLFGRSADYGQIRPGLLDRGVTLIEDAAEALGASFDGSPAGSFGTAAALSFNGNKIMTTSGGGMLVSSDKALIDHARKLSTQAREPAPWYQHNEVGYNYRLSNILAALGRGQLTRLDAMILRRRAIRSAYRSALDNLPGVRFLGDVDQDARDNCWLTCMVVGPEEYPDGADGLVDYLNGLNIEARHLWKPMHMQPLYEESPSFINGTSEGLFRTGIALPSGSHLTDGEVARVVDSVELALTRRGTNRRPANTGMGPAEQTHG
jgi:dTDP-4-amino-4,6-dideoxygalactose transaminase